MKYNNSVNKIFKGFFLGSMIAFQAIAFHSAAIAQAQQTSPANIEQLSLDNLFQLLKESKDEAQAREYETQIWRRWFQSGDKEVDELMKLAMKKRSGYDFNGAIEVLNQVSLIAPDYPELWNQLATVLFHQEKYEASLEAIAKTLELEPRHFGSLAGRAVIRMRQNKPVLAKQNIIEALKLHPFLRERSMFGL